MANGRIFKNDAYEHYHSLYNDLENLAKKYQVSTDAVALRFIMDNLAPSIILSGASNKAQLLENLKAKNFKLENRELLSLKQYSVDPVAYWNERKKLVWN